jgi:DNA modification methylase
MGWNITQGDVIDVLRTMPDESRAACLTDPPYGLGATPDMAEVLTHWLAGDDYKATGGGFMGKSWDSFVPGPAVWKEVYRVLKPGAILMAFAGTRTADLLSIAIRLAGFERWDEISYHRGGLPGQLSWVYGSGFPKSQNISVAIDREEYERRDKALRRALSAKGYENIIWNSDHE